MRTRRVVALVIGCLFVVPSIAAVFAGGALGAGYAFGRDDDGFFEADLERMETDTVAVTAEDIDLDVEPGTPGWIVDALDADVRLRVASADGADLFVGVGRQADVDAYLGSVAHDEVVRVDGDEPVLRSRAGTSEIAPPTEQTFWETSTQGPGTRELLWEVSEGNWGVVIMNADGSPGIAADVEVGAKADFVLPLALILLGGGIALTVGTVVLIVYGASGMRSTPDGHEPRLSEVPPHAGGLDTSSPVRLEAHLDPGLSNWKWLVKWFLAIPHLVVLAFLWVAFVVVTVAAGFSILFTGRYPARLFEFNRGVLRWTWRVTFYATTGGIGTDRYPPFSLGAERDYPATLEIEPPGELRRGLVLVKWWLLAIPHYLVLAVLFGGSGNNDAPAFGLGLLGVLVLIAGVGMLFTGQYNRSLFDLIVGLNRWVFRVIAYAALMTDRYPPFRLDQGGAEPEPRLGPRGPDDRSGAGATEGPDRSSAGV